MKRIVRGRRGWFSLGMALVLLLSACGSKTKTSSETALGKTLNTAPAVTAKSPVRFEEVTKASGISFTHVRADFDPQISNIMDWLAGMGATVTAADFNGDGCADAYVTNSGRDTKNALYKNNCDGTFTDVAEKAGLAFENGAEQGASRTATWGDYDNDGCEDLFIGKLGWSELYHNNCDGTFTRVTEKAGLKKWGYVEKAVWMDVNRDGCLDLYVGLAMRSDFDLWHLNTTRILWNDWQNARNGEPNRLYMNNCDGTFREAAKEYGVDDTGYTLAVGSADLNNDGWPDLYVANDVGPDRLYFNEHGERFTLVHRVRGISDDTYKGMNADFGDYDNNGTLDIYVTNITKRGYVLEGNMLWQNDGHGKFANVAHSAGAAQCGWGWGGKFVDLDNDGWLDIFTVNGFVSAGKGDYWFDLGTMSGTPRFVLDDTKNYPAMGSKSWSGHERSCLFLNEKNGRFSDVAKEAGIDDLFDGRGIAVVDYNNDGSPDLFVANQRGPLLLYKNRGVPENHWLKLRLVGTAPSTRDAIGARVTIKTGGTTQIREVDGGNGYGGQSDPNLLIGLGGATTVDELEIRWPSGRVEKLTQVPVDRLHTIVEGKWGTGR